MGTPVTSSTMRIPGTQLVMNILLPGNGPRSRRMTISGMGKSATAPVVNDAGCDGLRT